MTDERKAEAGQAKPANESDHYRPSIERLRLILMLFMCINLFGLPTAFGGAVQTFCGFVPISFFILSGYLVLRESENRSKCIARAIRRTAIVFAVLAAVYFAMNCFLYLKQGMNILPVLSLKRFWFNFLVMNVWQFDIGSAIWYVQALLYAYIIIYFLDKWKLLRFDWLIAVLLILLTVCTGELAGVFKWNVAGYTYLPGNFLTRAIPYVLLGGFFHRKNKFFSHIATPVYLAGIVAGIVLTVAEMWLLDFLGVPGYYGHLIGKAIIAICVCMLAFRDYSGYGFEAVLGMSRWHINCIYYLCQPVSVALVVMLSFLDNEMISLLIGFVGIITFIVCFFLAWLFSRIGRIFAGKKANEYKN